MILKKEYKTNNTLRYTLIDGIDKIDEGECDGVTFLNIYKTNRKKDDDFETVRVEGLTLYVMNDLGKTISIFRSSK